MDHQRLILELEEPLGRISSGLNAMKLMVYGLESTQDPFADGFYTVWAGLSEAEEEVRGLLDRVSTERTTA